MIEAVLKAVQMQIELVENMAEIISEINSHPTICNQSLQLTKQLQEKEYHLEKTIDLVDSLYMDWKCGEITRAEYVRMKSKFEIKAKELEDTIAHLKF